MKRSLIFLLFILVMTQCIAQQIESTPLLSKQDHLKKSKHQKTLACVLLPVASVATTLGFFAYGVEKAMEKTTNVAGLIVGVAGAAGIATSFVLFKSAKNHRSKAGLSLSMSIDAGVPIQHYANNNCNQVNPAGFTFRLSFSN